MHSIGPLALAIGFIPKKETKIGYPNCINPLVTLVTVQSFFSP